MAAKSKSVLVTGKHIINVFRPRASPRAVAYGLFTSRNDHTSSYDKNVEEALESSQVPEEMVKSDSVKYWSPHPRTGVFGPSSASATTTDEKRGGQEDSVMEEKAWFRQTSLEDLDKTNHS